MSKFRLSLLALAIGSFALPLGTTTALAGGNPCFVEAGEQPQEFPLDCNTNGVPDSCDILFGDNDDLNTDGIIDDCEFFTGTICRGDTNGDGLIDGEDLAGFINCLFADGPITIACMSSDLNADGTVDEIDRMLLLNALVFGDNSSMNGDSDGDETPDCFDECPYDRQKTAPGDCGCGRQDVDTDEDTVLDCDDPEPMNPFVCGDMDGDGCDDCAVLGMPDVTNDGTDTDGDGMCDTGDEDDDNDGVPDDVDPSPLDPFVCGDSDGDGCDDCRLAGTLAPENDGIDSDGDGICNEADTDDDNDLVLDENDPEPTNAFICGDSDGDGCDDCGATGMFNPAVDGVDSDSDGRCDSGDPLPTDIACPNSITIAAEDADGATVNYDLAALSDTRPGVTVTADPVSGTKLPVGDTTVTVTATDDTFGETKTCTFVVTVQPLDAPPADPNPDDGTGEPPAGQETPSCLVDRDVLRVILTLFFRAPICGMGCPMAIPLTFIGILSMRRGQRRRRRMRANGRRRD